MAEYLPIEKLEVTQRFCDISDRIWDLVVEWPILGRDTVGKQLIRAIDSVAANIVEGGHRHTGKDAIHFFVIARASGEEASHHLRRASRRKLLDPVVADCLLEEIRAALQLLSNLIGYRRRSNVVRDNIAVYGDGLSNSNLTID